MCAHIGLGGAEQVRYGRFGSGCGALVVSAVEDVVELRDGIAAFNADWHAARMLWVTLWRVWRLCKLLTEELCGMLSWSPRKDVPSLATNRA